MALLFTSQTSFEERTQQKQTSVLLLCFSSWSEVMFSSISFVLLATWWRGKRITHAGNLVLKLKSINNQVEELYSNHKDRKANPLLNNMHQAVQKWLR